MAIGFDPSTAIQALNDKDESFDEWKLKNAPEDTGEDYDLAGAFNANLHPAENGHFPDTFKKPNHPTFSKESIYSTDDQAGGEWGTDDQGRDTFKPSPWMGSDPARQENLKSYFKEKEPNATLIDPDPYEKPFDPSTAIPREEFIDKLVKDGTFDPANYKNFGVSKEDAFEVRQKKKDRTLVEKTKAFASGISGSTFAEAAKGVAKFIGGLAVMIGDANIQAIAPQVSRVLKGLGYNALAKNVDNELLSERRELALGASHGEEAVKSLGRNIGEFAGDISHWVSGGPRDDAKEKADFDEDIAAADREKQLHEGKFIKGSIVGKIAKAGSDMFGEGKDIESTLGAKHLEEEGARKANELTVEMLSAGMDPVNIALMLSSVATGGASSIAGKAATALAEAGVAGRVASGVIRGAMATSSGIAYIPKLVANTATRTLGAAASFPFKIIRAIPSRLGRITRIGETGITAGLAAEAAMHPALVAKAAGIAAIARVLDLMGKGLSAAGETTGKFGVTNLDQQILTGFRAGESNLLLKGSRALGQGVHKFIEVPIEFAPFNLASSGGDPNKFADMSIGAGMFGGIFATKAQFRSSAQKALNANAHGVRMIEHGAKNLGEVHPEIFAMHQANLFMFSDQIREEIQKCRSLSNGGLATDVLVLSPEQCNIIRADKAKYKIDIPEKFDTQCAVHLTEQGKILINTGRFGLVDGKIENFGGGVRNQAQYHEIGHAVLESIRKGVETAHGQSVIEMLKHSMSPEEQKKAATDYLNALYPKGIPALEIAKLEATPDLHLDESLSEISRSLLRGQDLARYGFSQESNRIITKKLGKILHGIARTMGMGLTQMDFGSFDMKVDISGERGPQFGQIWNQEEAKAINSILHEVGQRADRKMRGVSTDADREFYQKMREKPPVPPKDPEADPSPEPEPKPKGPEPEPEPIPKPEPEPEPIPKPEPILKFNADDYYENGGFYYPKDMKFGDLPPQGWKAHISATPENMENVLNVVLPILNKNNIRHKFTPIERFATKDKTSNLFDKLITIYGKTPEETARILQEIDSALLSKNLTEARWKDSPENRWGKSGMISYRFGEFLGWGDTNHPTLGKVKDGFIVDEKNGKIIWDDRKNNNQVDDDLLPLLNKIPKPKPTPEPIPKVGHLTQQEIFDAAKSDPANPIGAVIDAHKRNEEDHEGGLTVQDHTDARGVPFRTVDGVLIKGDPFSEYLLNQVLVGTERRPLTQEERDIITGLKTGSVNGFVYGHAGYDIASPIIVDVSRRRKIIENPAGERIDNPSRRQNEQKRALFVNAVFNERSRTITLQMLSVDKLNNNYQNLVEAIKIANDRGEHIDNPYTTDADVVVDLKNYAENYKNNWAGDGHQPVRDADGNPLSTIGEPHKIDFDKFNFINLLLANESLKSSTRLASARRRIARANGINLEVDLESNPLRKRLNEIFPKNPETRNSWSEDLFESPHEILRPELIRGINGDIDSKGGLRNVGPEFNEAFDKGIPDENMVAGNYMPKEEDDVEYYFTVSTGRQGAINNLIENGRSAEIPEIIKLVVINAFSDMKSIPMNIEDISGLYKESQQLDPTKEPAVRVSFKYKTEEELNAIRKRFCDLGEIWDQDEIYELTHNDSSKLDIGDQTNTMERIVKSIEINIRNLTEKNILRIAEESGINGLTISNGKILIYDQANEGREFDRKSDRFRELATEETGMAEEGDVGWVALRKFGRTTDVSKAVTGYQDRIVSDPNIADPFKFRGDLIKRLMMLGRVPDAPKNGKRSYYEKDDLSPIQINRHKVLARELEEAPDFDPSALDGYDKLCDELVKQYKALTAKLSNKEFDPEGIRFEMDTYQRKDPITGEIISGDLYKSSKEAVNDLFRNKRLRILKTDADAFGPPNSEWGEHPLLRQSGEVDANGQPMTYNDLLRGVHDTIAHSMFSDQFGQIGEEGAWQVHIRTISDVDARRALTAETRSQNSFVNFGSGMQNPDGTILKKGDAGWLSPTERPFGPQKVFLPKLENCLTGDKEVDAPVLDAIAERDAKYMPEDDSSLNSEEITLGDKNVSYMPSGKKVKEKKPKEKTEWKAGEDSLMEYEGEREQIAAVLADRFKNGLDNPDLLGPLKKLIQKYPRYLNGPLDHIVKSAVRLKLGEITHRELAKAYIMTIVSQGAGAVSLDALQKSLVNYNEKMKREKKPQIKFKINPSKIFLHTNKKGKIDVRPEEIAAYWITTKDGKKALDNLDYYAAGLTPKGLKPVEGATNPDLMPAKYRPEDFAIVKLLREFYGDDRVAGSGMMIGNEWAEGQETIRESRPSWEKEPFPSKASRRDDYGYKIQAKNEDGTPKLDWSEKKRGEVTLSNLSDALLEINKNKGNDVQGMINIFLRFKGIDSAKAPFIGHFIGFGQRVTLDAVEKNYEIGGTGDSRNFAKDQQESPYKAKKNPTEDEKKEIAKIRAEIKAKNDAVKLPFRKELEVLSGSSELQELAREFIENKIDQIRAERLAKNPNDPIGKIQNEAFFHIMHHWIWDAAKGIKTTHKGLYKSMDPKYMPAEEGSRDMVPLKRGSEHMGLAKEMLDKLANLIPELSPRQIKKVLVVGFDDLMQSKIDKLPPERQLEMDNFFKENETDLYNAGEMLWFEDQLNQLKDNQIPDPIGMSRMSESQQKEYIQSRLAENFVELMIDIEHRTLPKDREIAKITALDRVKKIIKSEYLDDKFYDQIRRQFSSRYGNDAEEMMNWYFPSSKRNPKNFLIKDVEDAPLAIGDRYMPSEEGKSKYRIEGPYDEYGDIDDAASDVLFKMAKDRGVNILRGKELSAVARDRDGKIVGGTFVEMDRENYTFDIVVEKELDGQGIGSRLLDNALNPDPELFEAYPDMQIKAEVTSPIMKKMLEKRGFVVDQKAGESFWVMVPKKRRDASYMPSEEGNLHFDKDSEIKLTDYGSQQILDKLQPNRGEVPKTDRITSGFVNGNTLSENDLYSIQENYSKWARRSGMTPTDLIQHIGNGNASVWSAYGTNDKFVGQFIGDTFVVSHFAPEGGKSAIGGLMDLLHTQTPVVFAVPDRIAGQLERLGFRRSKLVIPMMFKGEVMQKNLLANNAVTGSDTQKLAAWWVAESSLNGLLEKIGSSDLLDSAKEGINQLQLNSKDASYMPSEESIPEKKYKRKENEEMHKILQRALDRSEKNPQLTSEEQARINEIINEFKPVKQVPTKEILNGMPSQDEVNLAIHPDKRLKNKFDHDGKTEILSPWDKIDFDNIKTTGRQDVPAMNENNVGVVTIQQTNSEGKSFSIYVPFAVFDNNPILKAPQSPKIVKVGAGNDKKPDLAIIVGKLSRIQKIPYDIESWTQVGFNPDVHSYFYLKSDHTQGVTGGEKIVQVGNTVFVKNPVFATPEEQASYKYMPFAGEGATGFAEAEKKGDVFVNPFDLMKRFEISDDKMESLNAWRKLYNDGDQFDFILGDLYDHPELFKNYPWLKDIPVIVEFKNDDTNASVNYDGTQINVEFRYLKKLIDDVNFNNEKHPTQKMQDRADLKLKKTIIHEIQHLIQFEEKFAMGGNSAASSLADTLNFIKYAKQEALRKAVDKFNRSSSKDERAAIALDVSKMRTDLDLWDRHYKNTYGFSYGQFEPTITKMQLWQLYQSIAGEMESRAAADRSGMTSEDRKKFPVIFDTNYKDNPIVTFRLPSSEKYKSIEDANAKRLGVDRYMPADELADQLGVSGTLPDDMVGKGLSTWMHDLIEAFTKAEKDGNNAKAEEIREYLSSGGAGYALVNKGTGVCWASNYGAVKNLAGMLRSRGTPFRDKIDGDEYCYVAPYTMKGDALVSNVEYANQRIIDIRNWAKTQTPEEIKRFEARVQNWAAKNKQFLYSNFNIKDAKFEKIAGETAESGSFEARKKLMQYLSSEAISKEFNLPSGQYRAYKSIDPAYHGLVGDMETTGAMFHTIILKVNLTKLERATAVQDYRNYQNSVKEGGKKSGSADEKLIILDLVDKGIDVNKTKFVQDYRDYQEAVRSKKKKSGSKEEQQIIKNLLLGGVDESVIAKEKGSKAEEYGVDSHPSYDSIINGDVVAYLRNPVAAKTLRPTVFKNFDKYNADLKAKGYDKPVAYAGLETNYPLRGDMDDVKNVLVVSNAKERAAARQHNAKAKISGEELKEIPEIKWKYSEKFAPTPNQILTQELVDQANALQVTSRVGSEEIPKQTFDEYSKKTKSYRDKNEKAYQKFESSDKQFEQIKAALAYVKSKITAGKNMYKDINADIKEYNDAREEGTPEKEYIYPPEYEDLLNEAQTLNRAISLYESTIQRKKVKNREEKKLAKKSEREPILVPETASVSKWAFRALRIAGERDLTRNKGETQLLIEEERIRLEEKAKKEADEKAKKEAKKAKKEADEKAKKADEKAKKEANKEANKKSKIQENAEARIEAKS